MTNLLILFSTAITVLFVGLMKRREWLAPLAASGTLLCIALTAAQLAGMEVFHWNERFSSMLRFDRFADAFTMVVLVSFLLMLGLTGYGLRKVQETLGDYLGLIIFSLCGALCLFAFENLVMLFLGIEILSIPLYILAGSRRNDLAGNEAALKYYIMGAFTTGVFLFGVALVYGATGSFGLQIIADKIAAGTYSPALLNTGIALMTIGLCFKISAVPFHFWAPDVYEGSPNLVTVFMATVVKTAAIAAFYRLFFHALAPVHEVWGTTLAVISALTMTLANVTAIFQTNFKRMMAYSSISHAGFLLLGILSVGVPGSGGALLFYTMAYAVATICAFGIFILVSEQQDDKWTFKAFNGLGKTQPFLAAVMAICMLSLAGVPPAAGFFGKYFLFAAAFEQYPWLIMLAIANSAISIYYYFRVINAMYFTKQKPSVERLETPAAYRWVMWVGLLLLAALAVMPGDVYGLLP